MIQFQVPGVLASFSFLKCKWTLSSSCRFDFTYTALAVELRLLEFMNRKISVLENYYWAWPWPRKIHTALALAL